MGPPKVLVTGAGGKLGTIVTRKLLEHGKDKFETRALVRSQSSEDGLKKALGDLAVDLSIYQGNITKPETLDNAFQEVEMMVICTSAVPRLNKLSLPGVILTKLFTLGSVSKRPSFYFDDGGSPQNVDWIGQQEQINAARKAGVKYIVLVSSMGGTKPDHFLNANLDNIVLWKRRAECYLMNSGLSWTIIHPGGLLPHPPGFKPAPGGKRQLHVGLDDELMDPDRKLSTIPREDVAEVCVECLLDPSAAKGRSFDLGSGEEDEELHPVNIQELLKPLDGKNCQYSQADAEFKSNGNDPGGLCC